MLSSNTKPENARGPFIGIKSSKTNTEIIVNVVTLVHLIMAMFALYKIAFTPARNSYQIYRASART